MSKSIRRHHEARIKAKVSKWVSLNSWVSPEKKKAVVGKWSCSKAMCSCTMCGNPRKHFGHRKLNELVHIHDLKQAIQNQF